MRGEDVVLAGDNSTSPVLSIFTTQESLLPPGARYRNLKLYVPLGTLNVHVKIDDVLFGITTTSEDAILVG